VRKFCVLLSVLISVGSSAFGAERGYTSVVIDYELTVPAPYGFDQLGAQLSKKQIQLKKIDSCI